MLLAEFTFGQGLLVVLEIFVFAAWLMVLFTIIGTSSGTTICPAGEGGMDRLPDLRPVPGGVHLPDRARQRYAREGAGPAAGGPQQLDAYVRQTAGGGSPADELAKLAKLHDEKKISDAEFEQAKAKIVS